MLGKVQGIWRMAMQLHEQQDTAIGWGVLCSCNTATQRATAGKVGWTTGVLPHMAPPWAWQMWPFFGWPQMPHLYLERPVLAAAAAAAAAICA